MTDLHSRIAAVEAAVLALANEELGDHEGHKFHGNQHVSFDDEFDTPKEQHKRLERDSKRLKAFIGAAEEFGDTPGHQFHGNQWTYSVGDTVKVHGVEGLRDGTPAKITDRLRDERGKPTYGVDVGQTGHANWHVSEARVTPHTAVREPAQKTRADRESREAREMRMIRNTDSSVADRIDRMSGSKGDAARRNYVNSGTDPSWYGG